MSSRRLAGAVGGAAAVGATVLLTGSGEGSVVTVMMLIVAARAAATVLGNASATAPALGRLVVMVPAWAAVVAVGAVRAGSPRLADVRGANAVAGLAIARGEAALVVAVWFAALAGIAAIAASGARGITTSEPGARLDVVATALELALIVTMFAGPQPQRASDALVWVIAAAATTGSVLLGKRRMAPGTLGQLALGGGLLAVVIAALGDGL